MNTNKPHKSGWALMTPVEQVEREKQDYKLLVEDKIKCGGCNRPLVEVLKVKDSDTTTEIKVYCPLCEDTSFKYRITGKIYIQAIDGLSITEMPVEIKNNITYTEIRMVKNE